MNIAKSPDHLSERVTRYVNVVRSLSGEALADTLNNLFGSRSRKIIVGGLVRDLARGGIASRHFDVDVVLDLDPAEVAEIGARESATPNRFGGFGTVRSGWKIDFWALSSTWAHKAGHAELHYPVDIIDTTFFNVDAVAYDIGNHRVYMYEQYLDELRNSVLEIKLEPNPSIEGNTVRAVRRLKMWNYKCGPRLASFLRRNFDDTMFRHVIETETRLYGKSYAAQYESYRKLLDDLIEFNSKSPTQLEFDL